MTARPSRAAAAASGPRHAGRRLATLVLGALAMLAGDPAAAATDDAQRLREQRAAFKQIEADLILEPARREWRERREQLRELRRRPRRGVRAQPVDSLAAGLARRGAPLAGPRNPAAIAANVRMNPAPGYWTQSEVSIARIGSTIVAAWNDGALPRVTGILSYGYSLDDGRTWRGGLPWPVGNGVLDWESDPVVAADPKRGEFWLAGLAIALQPPSNAIGVLRGAVTDTGIVWREIAAARAPRDTLPDKPWIAVDSLSGTAFLSYTSFFPVRQKLRDQIELVRSEDGGHSWSPPLRLSSDAEQGLVQGSRPVVGPDGEVHVAWGSVDTTDAAHGLDFMRMRTSRDGGRSFAPPADMAGVITNFASGAPGFNRPNGINFPSLAVDHSDGPYRGRVYATWTESADYYAQPIGSVRPIVEAGPGQPDPEFEVGDLLRGRQDATEFTDQFRFQARRGETALFFMDSLAEDLDVALGIGCGDNPYELVFSDPPVFGRGRIALATFPRDGEFLLSVVHGRGGTGPYRIRTGWVRLSGRGGRDVRDVFVAYSNDGLSWSAPTRVSDAPPWYDDWLPEVAVATNGDAYVAWYDWRASPAAGCGALSNVSLSRSTDGGRSWSWLGLVSDRPSDWAAAESNLVPNQGDYIALFADSVVSVGWADARGGTPDAFFARFDPGHPPSAALPSVALAALRPNPTTGAVSVTYGATPGVPARLELWDVSGRRVQEQVIDTPASRADLRFTPRSGLRAGVYVLRIVQGRASATARLAIVP